MIHELPDHAEPLLDPALLDNDNIVAYLGTIERDAPGMDWVWDRAVVEGITVIRDTIAGGLQRRRDLAALTFDRDEYLVLVLAALKYLVPLFHGTPVDETPALDQES
jgi:hypothetical protein